MLKSSKLFSLLIFWIENICFYIPKTLVWEIILIPLIYLRLTLNIIRTESNVLHALRLSLSWIIIGPFYLLYNLVIDMYHYVQVLRIYHEEDGDEDQDEEDKMQDCIVIYNEVIDTMRAVMAIFKHK